jgi:pre-mRNA-processing factor 40
VFQEFIRGLEEVERQEREKEKEARRRQERRNRDAFRQLLQQHRCVVAVAACFLLPQAAIC